MLRAALLAGVMTLGLAAGAVAQDKAPVKIAAIIPQSGAGAFDGQLALEGMQAEAAEVFRRLIAEDEEPGEEDEEPEAIDALGSNECDDVADQGGDEEPQQE